MTPPSQEDGGLAEAGSRRGDRLEERVVAAARRHRLFEPGARVICAVSGGADSIALLHALVRLRERLAITVEAAHVHHGISEALSDEALALCRDTAERLGIRLHVLRADVPGVARRRGVSLEAAGRRVRYGWFRRLLRRAPAIIIATAHTADDQAETVLLRLLRGAGLRGLGGIRRTLRLRKPRATQPADEDPRDEAAGAESVPDEAGRGGGRVVRPLLDVGRAETRAYVERHGLAIVEDPTNQDTSFSRNRVRHVLLPLLEDRFNPAVVEALCRFAESARQDDVYLRIQTMELGLHVLEPRPGGWLVNLKGQKLKGPVRARMWQLALERGPLRYDLADNTLLERLDDLLFGRPGREVPLPSGGVAVRTYDGVILQRERQAPPPAPPDLLLPVPCDVLDPARGLRIRIGNPVELPPESAAEPGEGAEPGAGAGADVSGGVDGSGCGEVRGAFQTPSGTGQDGVAWTADLDAEALKGAGPLCLRAREPGDRWHPPGHHAPEKLKEAFNRWRVPPADRDLVPLLAAGRQIVAVVGYGVDGRFAARPATERIVRVEVTRLGRGEPAPPSPEEA